MSLKDIWKTRHSEINRWTAAIIQIFDSYKCSICVGDVSVQFSSVAQSCPTRCDLMNHSTPGLPVHHQLPEFTQTHIHRVGDAIQPSHPLSSPSLMFSIWQKLEKKKLEHFSAPKFIFFFLFFPFFPHKRWNQFLSDANNSNGLIDSCL